MTVIRRATAADLDLLPELWLALGAEGHRADARYRMRADAASTVRTFMADRWLGADRLVLVAEAADGLAGFMATAEAGPHPVLDEPLTLQITDAYVAPAHRRRGIGRALLAAVEQRAHERGFVALEVGTLALDGRAVAFWRALGFGDWRVSLRRPTVPTSRS